MDSPTCIPTDLARHLDLQSSQLLAHLKGLLKLLCVSGNIYTRIMSGVLIANEPYVPFVSVQDYVLRH